MDAPAAHNVFKPLAGGCLADLVGEAQWSKSCDDRVRMRVPVGPQAIDGASQADVEQETKRVAVGLAWITADGQPFPARQQNLSTAQP